MLMQMLLPAAAWLGALQALSSQVSLEQSARLAGIASLLGTLTAMIYRLGVWRQEMENTKHSVGAEIRAYREESARSFARLERRLQRMERRVDRGCKRGIGEEAR
jgi:hypothetical protein